MKNIIYTICCIILLTSCSKDDISNTREDGCSIVLTLKPSDPLIESRATESGDDILHENKIENLHVFFFPQNAADNQACINYEYFTGLSFDGSGVSSKTLSAKSSAFTVGSTYDIYTVVNLPSDVTVSSSITLGALKSLATVTPISPTNVQSNFVMDGKSSVILNPTTVVPTVNITMPLKRAASKVRVKFVIIPGLGIENATTASVALKNFAKKTSLLDVNPTTLSSSDYTNTSYVTQTPSSTFTFYCYQNSWSSTPSNETYLMVNIPYPSNPSNYYRVPINKYTNNSATGKIDRNAIYDITLYVDRIGSTTESGTVETSGSCTISNWSTRDVILKTINQHYLGVSEYNIIMANISSYTLKYVSDLPISITNVTASCVQYSSTGATTTINYTSGQSQFPTFTINTATSTITINSSIPINYVPKNITFTVTNNQGLSLNITVVQYPLRYVTARLSTGNVKPVWNTGGQNLNLYTINTLVPSSDNSYTLGDPTNGYALTDSTTVGNKVVSPKFIIASQYGIFDRVTYPAAQYRCFTYGEDIYRSGWRMPTKAEIELVSKMQDDPNSAVKGLLTGDAYWSAYKYDYYNFTGSSWVISNSAGTAYIRAVYDIYKHE